MDFGLWLVNFWSNIDPDVVFTLSIIIAALHIVCFSIFNKYYSSTYLSTPQEQRMATTIDH